MTFLSGGRPQREKFPLMSVTAPLVVPSTIIDTPTSRFPFPSVTVQVIKSAWAESGRVKIRV